MSYSSSSRGGGGGYDRDCKVYVGDLPENARKEELEDAFNHYGRLRSVWVARNPPGFAFIEFEDSRDAKDAVKELDGTRLCGGKEVKVEIASGLTKGWRPWWWRRLRWWWRLGRGWLWWWWRRIRPRPLRDRRTRVATHAESVDTLHVAVNMDADRVMERVQGMVVVVVVVDTAAVTAAAEEAVLGPVLAPTHRDATVATPEVAALLQRTKEDADRHSVHKTWSKLCEAKCG
ncbi:uncharacterized protein [Amphiura filiformis]|uniref:uncharacterized protein n=1 Tax=Amphiura filiformis TaxID=82378 RepID=UPI003B21FBDE